MSCRSLAGTCNCTTGTSDSYSFSEYGDSFVVHADCTGFKGASGLSFDSADPAGEGPPGCGGGAAGAGPGAGGDDGDDGNAGGPVPGGGDPLANGMPVWHVSEPNLNVWLFDRPSGYKPGIGPKMSLSLAYNMREPMIGFNTNLFGLGKRWNFPWFAFIATNWANSSSYPKMEVHFAGGGAQIFNGTNNSGTITYGTEFITNRKLSGDTTNGFTLNYPDGSQDVYGMVVTNNSGVFQKAFLSERRNRFGQKVRLDYFSYDPAAPVIRLKDVVDGDGATNSIGYVASNDFSTNLIGQIADPFGRSVNFGYSATGCLTNLVDAAGITNSFQWDEHGWITNMLTPYGRTAFQITDTPADSAPLYGHG